MYIPRAFLERDEQRTRELVDTHAFGLLVTTGEEGLPVASHIPLLSREDAGAWMLEGHVARPNEQSGHIVEGRRALVVFQGPHSYVSPTWYENPGVPTWNYAAVHVYGRLKPLTGEDARGVVERLAARFEGEDAGAWVPDYPDKMLEAIQCFALIDLTVQSKSKMSQNRSETDRIGVIEALERKGGADEGAVARIMRDNESRGD